MTSDGAHISLWELKDTPPFLKLTAEQKHLNNTGSIHAFTEFMAHEIDILSKCIECYYTVSTPDIIQGFSPLIYMSPYGPSSSEQQEFAFFNTNLLLYLPCNDYIFMNA